MKNSARSSGWAGLLLSAPLLLCACASNLGLDEERIDDGLVLVERSRLDELYVAPGVSLAHYQRVSLDPVEVAFKPRWRKDHPELTDKEVADLQTRLATMLQEKLVQELAAGGYVLAESPANDVLRLRASLVDVDIVAPASDEAAQVRTYIRSAGEMTLRLQAFDSQSGALVARARDYERDPESRNLERADRITNNVAARRLFGRWAEALRSALDVAKVQAGARTPK